MDEHHSGVAWREWNAETFAEARAQDKPILLDIGAVWCHWCHVMDDGIPGDPLHTGTYSDPDIQQRIAQNFIPVKVDNDKRPDINARYNMGGWPTTAFLTPDGDTLYGETYVPPPRMIALLDYIDDFYRNQKDQLALQTEQVRLQRAQSEEKPDSAGQLDPNTVATVVTAIKRSFDPVYGGFGTQPKFPHPASLKLALEVYAATHDAELQTVIEKTLQGMANGGMYDPYAGGFFRYSTTRDWSIPHFEKMLEDNAKLTSAYALASVVLDDPSYLDTVVSAHGWLLTDMRDPETGTFAGSQDADQEEEYYGQPLSVRTTLPTPYIDRTVYANWNALMVTSLLDRYRVAPEGELLETAKHTFRFLQESLTVSEVSKNGDTRLQVRHFWSKSSTGGSLGLLTDQTAFAAAALDLWDVTGEREYLTTAIQAAEPILEGLQDETQGGFYDLRPEPDAIGELAHPKKEMTENAEAALVLMRLAACTENAAYRQAAERALSVFAGDYAEQAYFAAPYARAVAAALSEPLHIVIVGSRDDVRLQQLQQTAWHTTTPGKTVETLDPALLDPAHLAERGYPVSADGTPRAYVCIGTQCLAPVQTPEALEKALQEVLGRH